MTDSIPELCNNLLERLFESGFEPAIAKVQSHDTSIESWNYGDTSEQVQSFREDKIIEEVLLDGTESFERLVNSDEKFSNLYDELVEACSNYCDEKTAIKYVKQAIKTYLSRNDRSNEASALKTKISSDLKEAVSNESHECELKFFVHGIETDNNINLDFGNLMIRSPTKTEIAEHVMDGDLENCPGSVFTLEKELTSNVDKENVSKELRDQIRACSLIGASHPKIGAVTLNYRNEIINNEEAYLEPAKSDFSTKLDENSAEYFKEVKDVFEDIEDGSYLEVAQRRYEKATEKGKSDINRLVDAVIGLDAIYTDRGSELSHKVTHRCSLMTSLLGQDPVATRQKIKRAYVKRSEFVHGETPESPSEDVLETALDCLRKSIIIFSQIGKDEDRESLHSYTDKAFISTKERQKIERLIQKKVPENFINPENMLNEVKE